MALTGIQIFKLLPKTNCKECKFPTCLAFAMKLAAKQASLDACPYISDEAKELLGEASAPPVRLITIGKGGQAVKTGEETVLFRHEKTFVNPTLFTLKIDDTDSDEDLEAKVEAANKANFERVGQHLSLNLIMVANASGQADTFAGAVEKIQAKSDLALILASVDPEAMEAGLKVAGENQPLIYAATESNYEKMAALAVANKCPLAVSQGESLDQLADLVDKVKTAGVKDIVLAPGTKSLGKTLADLTTIRRAALKKSCPAAGFPTLCFASNGASSMDEALRASVMVMKYAGIVVLSSIEEWKTLALFTLRQNIYTDPQQPLQVEEKMYKIGEAGEDSPVFITTNFSLTYFIVAGEIENSRTSAWLLIVDTEGMSVLTGWAADKFNASKIGKMVKSCGIEDAAKTRKLVLPGYVAVLSGEVSESLPDWDIVVGPREASGLPAFIKAGM